MTNGRATTSPCGSGVTVPPVPSAQWATGFARRSRRGGGELTAILSLAANTDVITFSGGFPAPETFPVEALQTVVADLLSHDAALALQYSPTEGLPEARDAVRTLLHTRQGRDTDDCGLLVTSGGIEALELLARTFVDAGDRVLVEAPSYLGAIMAFTSMEAQVEGVNLDEDGLVLERLEQALESEKPPKLLYVVPDHQNPTGISLAHVRRQDLVDLCRRHGVLLVEDVAYRQLAFDGVATPSLWSLAPDVVVQIGTFSKILTPGIRLGWAVGPRPVIDAMTTAKQNSDQCSGALGQMLMARFIQQGFLEPNLVASRRLYAARAAAMLDALQRHMPAEVTWTKPAGGFFIWLTAGPDVDSTRLAQRASEMGVAYVPGAPFFTDDRGKSSFRLAFSRATIPQIQLGIERLSALLTSKGS